MPSRAAHGCKAPGCNALVYDGGYCDRHRLPSSDSRRETSSQRGYGAVWRKSREAYLLAHPLCADPFGIHKRLDEHVAATDVDHIIARRQGGGDQWSNLRALCHSCHSRKTVIDDGALGEGA